MQTSKPKILTPYIGVTDFTTRAQVEHAKAFIHKGSGRRLHVGAMRSYKTHHGVPTKTGWENIWLKPEGLQALFVPDDEVFNVLHWADYDKKLTNVTDLVEACNFAGAGLNGLQLDMLWPDAGMIAEFILQKPDIALILQVSKKAIKESKERNTSYLVDLEKYAGLVDYILLDHGMGTGASFVAETLFHQIKEVKNLFPEQAIAVGGGLGPHSFHTLTPLLQRYPLISWDAQGQLRTSKNALDPIEMPRVTGYLRGSSLLASSYNK